MQQLILKTDLDETKIKTLLSLLKSWNIEAQFKNKTVVNKKKQTDFTLSSGIWKNYNIEATTLRNQAWNKKYDTL